jgi:hypothetical protein
MSPGVEVGVQTSSPMARTFRAVCGSNHEAKNGVEVVGRFLKEVVGGPDV